jgi:hypothetical protein
MAFDVTSLALFQMIYITRNPRDSCISNFNHWKVLKGYFGSLDTFVDAFLNDTCGYYTPFMEHVLGYWSKRHEESIFFVTYEEMKDDLASVIKKLGIFLNSPVDEKNMHGLLKHLSFDMMKNNKAVNKQDLVDVRHIPVKVKFFVFCHVFFFSFQIVSSVLKVNLDKQGFMRQGEAGNWKKHLKPEMVARFEEWEAKWLNNSDLKFVYEV